MEQALMRTSGPSSDMPGQPGPTGDEGDDPPAAEPVDQDTPVHLGDLILGPEATHWSRLLIQDHLDSGAQLTLSRTCTAARDLVLVTAKHATLRWDVNDDARWDLKDEARVARLQAVMQARGKLRTTLDVTTGGDSDILGDVMLALDEGTTWLDELCVRCDGLVLSTALAAIAFCCPNLRALHIHALVVELPGPHLFPNLKELLIREPEEQLHQELLLRTTSPYLKQLTSLKLDAGWCEGPDVAAWLFSPPDNVGAHLHTLHLNTSLTGMLLGLILQCAPALEDLKIPYLHLESDAHAHTAVLWRRLQCTELSMSALPRLPLTAGLELVCGDGGLFELFCDSADQEAVAARLQDMQFSLDSNSNAVRVEVSGVNVGQEPTALRMALGLIRRMRLCDDEFPRLTLQNWAMCPQLMQELPGLPHWQQLQFTVHWQQGEPQVYAPLLSLLPDSYRDVKVYTGYIALTIEQVESICMGTPQDRTPPVQVTLYGCEPDLMRAVKQKMLLGLLPHVVVERFEG